MRNVEVSSVEVQDWLGNVLKKFDTIEDALTFEEDEADKYNAEKEEANKYNDENGCEEDDSDFDGILDDLYIIPYDSEGRELPLEI